MRVNKVIVYLEGPSDKLAMEQLLAPLLTRLEQTGIAISSIPTGGKRHLMVKTPAKAVNVLKHDAGAIIV